MPDLSAWRAEIESLTGGSVVTVPVETDRAENVLRIPPAFPGRDIVRGLLMDERFVVQFIRAHAMNANYSGSDRTFHFILINTALAKDWEGMEEAVVAHEYGHIWLNATGYRSPVYRGDTCATTVAGDIVQHPLIFVETRRRGFDYQGFWIRNFERWLGLSESVRKPDECQRLIVISHWLDALLSVPDSAWPGRDRFLETMIQRHTALFPAADALFRLLRRSDLWDRSIYDTCMAEVLRVLNAVYRGETIP